MQTNPDLNEQYKFYSTCGDQKYLDLFYEIFPKTVLVFDDWFCFYGDPAKGERRAFHEFCKSNPDLIFEDYIQTNEAKAFIYLGKNTNGSEVHHGTGTKVVTRLRQVEGPPSMGS